MSFWDVNIICEEGKFLTSVYRKLAFSGVYTHFDSFIPNTYKIGTIYTLINRCFQISSSLSIFHPQSTLSREIFQENGYPENFIDKCFQLFLNRIHILKEKIPTVEKKPLWLVLPCLGTISLQSRTKLQVIFKSQNKLCNSFRFKDHVAKISTSGVVYKFQCGLCNGSYYGECVRHLAVICLKRVANDLKKLNVL